MLFHEGIRNWARRKSAESAATRQSGIGAWVGRRAEKRSGLLAAAIAGAGSAFALPPFFLIPLLAVSFPVFIWLIFGAATARRAGLIGVVFGLGHHVVGLYWISHSLLIDPWRHGWLIPFLVGGLALLLALFVGLAAAGALVLAGRRILPLLLALTAFWVLGEWLRSWVFTGFPWNLLGSVWLISERMIQIAAVTGTWGLSLLSLLVAGSFALLADGTSTRLARISTLAIAAFLLGSTYFYGMHRLSIASTETVERVRLRLVQPNITQTLKWAPGLAEAHLTKLMAMSMADYKGQRITHVIWPETAVPFALERSPGLAEALARVVPPRRASHNGYTTRNKGFKG